MTKALIKTLQGVPTNGNLPLFNALRLKVKDNGSTLQNVNIYSAIDEIEYDIVNNAFSFANRDGTTKSEYSVTTPKNSTLYSNGYEIPANAVGQILIKNTLNIDRIIFSRGNFEINAKDLYDLILLTNFDGAGICKFNGDITPFIADKQITNLAVQSSSVTVGTFKEVQYPESFVTIKAFDTGINGDITDFVSFTNLTTLWLTNNKFKGTIEDLVAGLVINGRTSGTINLAVNGTQVTFQGRLTNKGADLTWNGVNNITYNAFN
jgi:hypothetical protein